VEFFFIFTLLIVFILAILILPERLTPRCPICNGRLESVGTPEIINRRWGWNLVSRQFVCTECLYQRNRVEITRAPQSGQNETNSVH